MKLDYDLPEYYASKTQSGMSKRRFGDRSGAFRETVRLMQADIVISKIAEVVCTLLIHVPSESLPGAWIKFLLLIRAYKPAESIYTATHVVVDYKNDPKSSPILIRRTNGVVYFDYQCIRYSFVGDGFKRISPIDFIKGPALTSAEVTRKREILGPLTYSSHISPSTMGSVLSIVRDEIVLSPMIYFQLFCAFIWTVTKYNTYAIVVLILVGIERFVAMRQSYLTWCHLHEISSNADNQLVTVVRLDELGQELKLSVLAKDVVPGDHILITPNTNIVCDCVLIKGEVISDVSFVTGESHAVRSVAVPPGKVVKSATVGSSLLLCGSKALRTRAAGGSIECRAIVVANGFHTLQGDFLLSVLFRKPTPAEERVELWLIRSVGALLALGVACMGYAYFVSGSLGLHSTEVSVRVFDILTDALPPSLPLAFSIATLAASFRLPLYISTPRSGRPAHLLAGLVSKVVLDKTNTITTSEMSVTGVLEASSQLISRVPARGSVLEAAVAACNYLAVIQGKNGSREVVGDPLELALVQSIRWEVDIDDDSFVKRTVNPSEPRASQHPLGSGTLSPVLETANTEINIEFLNQLIRTERTQTNTIQVLSTFPFNPVSMRMSVVARLLETDKLAAFSKGAYEQVVRQCHPDSVPLTIGETYERLSSLGYRILGYAFKPLPADADPSTILRDQVESDMHFAGLVLLSNELHPESRETIRELRNSNIKVYLCTGDSSGTAVAVARQCGITGKVDADRVARSDSFIYRGLNEPLLNGGYAEPSDVVLSRMTPDDKAVFVESLALEEELGAVLMCGDGPNDANALTAADVGVVVNAQPNPLLESAAGCMACLEPGVGLRAVVEIIARGRSALAVVFCVTKIVISYAVIEGTCVALCYSLGDNLTDFQYTIVDMVIVLPTVLILALFSRPANSISQTQPHPPFKVNAIGLGFHCVLSFVWQVAALQVLKAQDWYIPFQPTDRMLAGRSEWVHSTEDLTGHENTVLFTMCSFQCVLLIVNYTYKALDRWCTPVNKTPIVFFWLRVICAIACLIASASTVLRGTPVGELIMHSLDLVPLQGMFVFQFAVLIVSQSFVSSIWEWNVLPRLEREIFREYRK